MSDDSADSIRLRAAMEEAIAMIADGSSVVSGWLALDCAQMLLEQAHRDLRGSLSPERAAALRRIAHDIRILSSHV